MGKEVHGLDKELQNIPFKHEAEQAALLTSYRGAYKQWHFQLRSGYGLLFFGFGSKKVLLDDFAANVLTDGPVVVINGYLPILKTKQLLFTVVKAVWESVHSLCSRRTGQNPVEPLRSQSAADLLAYLQDEARDMCVYVVVNNIDGPGLREDAFQHTLSTMASCPCVRFLASIDNVNAPLCILPNPHPHLISVWDRLLGNSKFNWWWHHTPTYAEYCVEGARMPLFLKASSSLETARSAGLVLKSLTPNARSVFKILAEHQLFNRDDIGMSLHQLHVTCREQFLVSSELTLRAHLTEFKDHDLIRWRKGLDGQDCLHISLAGEALVKLFGDLFSC